MIKETYSGLVLTGPMDGKFVRGPTDILRAAQPLPPLMPVNDFTQVPVQASRDTVEYQHVDFHYAENYPDSSVRKREAHYGFWVPFGTESPREFVITTLAAAYGRAR